MECQRLNGVRMRTSFGDWAAFAAILLIAQFFLVVTPLHAQNTSPSIPDPFEDLQARLDAVADDQLTLAKDTRRLMALSTPRSQIPQTTDAEPSNGSLGLSMLRRTEFSERRGESLGVDPQRILVEESVPVQLLGLARVESNFNPLAVSQKGAAGLWQFMPVTARRYGLRVDALQDDRFDVDKSTRAAGRYLRDLYVRFGSWPLAFAAYNVGEATVLRAIKRTSNRNFDSINRVGLLPAETRAYVPAVLKAIGAIEAGSPCSGGHWARLTRAR